MFQHPTHAGFPEGEEQEGNISFSSFREKAVSLRSRKEGEEIRIAPGKRAEQFFLVGGSTRGKTGNHRWAGNEKKVGGNCVWEEGARRPISASCY